MNLSKSLIEEWKVRNGKEVDFLKEALDKVSRESDPKELDETAIKNHQKVSSEINCLDCGNCCRTSVTDFSKSDIKRIAKHLEMTPKAFIKKYLIEDIDGTYVTITSPCPFLDLNTNACSIYDIRPSVCISYPHTQRDGFCQSP